ncbi:MAG: 50S ribosomal protein L11 methyltransferase, partial [Desulfamplus sp.]|nr:50S ribosomal protein L11 methyltransferase [Desulfamplus sp.]
TVTSTNTVTYSDTVIFPEFDLVAANIIAEVLIEIMPDIKKCVKTDGTIILSGIIKEKETAITECLDQHCFSILEVITEGEWVAIAAKKDKLIL